ncbi:nuclear transport factor 2 family protein [Sphingomonas crocodyli]|uniref:Nuclear transport factor 2 family protein n=1 Tax=Sphingomonas crocodyli TaxID=1979270 RepID=A0A437M629_9SPHN|nr:nuclear transport factor 2 family protein [Sphingomonas crocodyli]RVT93181.1 nuclear transport factor 2 family protein [Sphingomonas crocodyli]
MSDMETQLQQLLDKQAITERIYDYGRSMDRLDKELGYAVFHADCPADYGEQMFVGTGHGFVDMCMSVHPHFHAHSHQFSNIRIWIDGPDKARSETYADVTLRRYEGDQAQDIRNLGRYIDRWEKRDGEWRIAERKFVLDFDVSGPATGAFATTGKRDRTDPSYFGN